VLLLQEADSELANIAVFKGQD